MTEEEVEWANGDRSIFADLLPDEKTRKASEATQEYFAYLDDLRERGETNMFGAVPYLMAEFDLNRGESREVLSAWMKTFREETQQPVNWDDLSADEQAEQDRMAGESEQLDNIKREQ